MFHVEITTDIERLLESAEQWNALAEGIPFRETSWLGPWWKHYSQGHRAVVVIARDEHNEIRGILPLYTQAEESDYQTLRIIGDGDAFSEYSSVICRQKDAVAVGDAMGKFLAAETQWGLLQLEGIVEGDAAIVSLCRAMQQKSCVVHADSRMHTWFRARNENWDEHLKQFGRSTRRKLRRWLEKVSQIDELEKHTPESPEDAQQFLQKLMEMHQKRWNSVGEAGSYASPTFRNFISDCVAEFHSRGMLYLPSLRWSGDVVCSEMHFVGGNRRLYCYSTGFDIDRNELEPGRILNADTLHQIYEQDWAGVDYLRGDEPYKKRMGATPTRVLRVLIAAPALVPKLRHAAWVKGFEVKQLMRRCTGRKPVELVDILNTPQPASSEPTAPETSTGAPLTVPVSLPTPTSSETVL